MKAPVALFVYARPDHASRTVEALLDNPEAADTDLIVFSDAAKTPDKSAAVEEVRYYVDSIQGFRSVTVNRRPFNFGLAKSIIEGVTQVLRKHDSVIVLEDDMITSPHFLAYMNDGLSRYANDERVISLHGYMYPVSDPLPEAFFLRGTDCWGWATWRRGWALFNPDGQFLLDELRRQKLVKAFDFNNAYDYSTMLQWQIAGSNDSWAIRWYASAFLANKLTLYPGKSLVHNIGNDSSGTHCGTSTALDVGLTNSPIDLSGIQVEPSEKAAKAIERFFRTKQPPLRRLLSRVLRKKNYLMLARIAKDWLPPALLRQLRRMHRVGGISFEGPIATWDEAVRMSSGYDSQQILDKVLAAAFKVKNGEAVYERDSVLFDEAQYAWPVAAGLMWAAAQDSGRLSVLDFGGSLGCSYFHNRQFLQGLKDVRWSIVEQAHFVTAGMQYIQDEQLRFYETILECVKDEKPNVVLLSSVLQYLEKPYEVLESLSEIGAMLLIIDRSPFWSESTDGLLIQHVPPQIYPASYPTHIFSEPGFLAWMLPKWSLTAEFLSPEGYVQSPAGRFAFKGFLLKREH